MRITYLPSLFISWLLLLSGAGECFAQKEANVWVFGDGIGINFNNNRFISFNVDGFNQFGASASICDKRTGELLFYTEGRNIWDRTFRLMPNGTDLRGGYAATQAALIVPVPDNEYQYYLFTTKALNDTFPIDYAIDSKYTGLHYSVVDMRQNRGFGDVLKDKKNVLLLEEASEQLTAIPHSNGKDYWLITHEWGTNRFIVYPVTANGVGSPRFFPIGSPFKYSYPMEYADPIGWMVPSPNGKMLAMAVSNWFLVDDALPLELYDFDASAGVLSNRRELGKYTVLNGVSFSPDNSKLYFSNQDHRSGPYYGPGGTFQFDLSKGSLEEILESKTELKFIHETGLGRSDTLGDAFTFQLAPDGRLYTSQISIYRDSNGKTRRLFGYIDQPNRAGLACKPMYRELVAENPSGMGQTLPNLMQHCFNGLEPVDNSSGADEVDCENLQMVLYPNPTDGQVTIFSKADCQFPINLGIYNALGQLLSTYSTHLPPYPKISIEKYPAGTYYFVFTYKNRAFTKKLIKL